MNLSVEICIWAIYAVMLVCFAAAVWCMGTWRRTGNVPRGGRRDDEHIDALPSLTVVVFTEDGEQEVAECVERLRAQDYGPLQIVVVCRATAAGREMLVGRFADIPNVYVTFIPPGSHNLSERKLAITLGMKAARGDIVLTTSSNIRPSSDRWLRQMAAPFSDPAIEMVLGFSHMDFGEMRGPGRWYRQFDSVLVAGQWIGYALAGKPYRGDGYNLAFRRETFFANKGYAKNIFLHYGDDDLFVHQVADGSNTAVCLDSESIVTTCWGSQSNSIWTQRKARYQFTSRWLPRAPFARAGALSLMNWLVAGCGVAMALLPLPVWWPAVTAAVTWLALQGVQIWLYRRMAAALGAVRLWVALPFFMLAHPLLNWIFKLKTKNLRKVNYTWQR